MLDWFVILAPVLLLPIVALLRFVGCYHAGDWIFGSIVFDSVSVNCGGPHDFDEGVTYVRDDGGDPDTELQEFESIGGSTLKASALVKDGSGSAATVYGTARTGPDIVYKFSLVAGTYRITLRFAEIGTAGNPGDRVFSFKITNSAGSSFDLPDGSNAAYDIVAKAGGPFIAHDEQVDVVVTTGLLTIHLQAGSGSGADSNALINAIECIPVQLVIVTPAAVPIIENQTQQFTALASWDSSAAIAWSVAGPGQITASGLFTAPGGITVKTPSQIQATALFNGQPISGTASVSIYPHTDASTPSTSWVGKYGIDGYVLANNPQAAETKLPSYAGQFAAARLDGTALDVFTFQNTVGTPGSLPDPGSPRAAIMWDDPSALPPNTVPGFTLSFDLDSQPRLFGVYCVDFDAAVPPRDQVITILNADNQAVLATDEVMSFAGGVFLFWVLSGRIQIQVKPQPNTGNAVVSGVFFG